MNIALIKIELFLKYTLPTSCFIKIYSLGGFVFPLDIFNLYESIFTKLKFYRECIDDAAASLLVNC